MGERQSGSKEVGKWVWGSEYGEVGVGVEEWGEERKKNKRAKSKERREKQKKRRI